VRVAHASALCWPLFRSEVISGERCRPQREWLECAQRTHKSDDNEHISVKKENLILFLFFLSPFAQRTIQREKMSSEPFAAAAAFVSSLL
jgi:hypothetical protein